MAALVQSATNSQAGATSITVTLGSPTHAGNCLVVCISTENSVTFATTGVTLGGAADHFASIQTLTDTGSSVWTVVDVWADPSCAGGQTSVVVTANQTVAQMVWVYEFSGMAPTIAALTDQAAITSGTSASWSSGATAVTSAAAEVWIGTACIHNSVTPVPVPTGPSSPWANLAALSVGTLGGGISGYQITSATGAATYSGTETGGTLAQTVAGVITLFTAAPATAAPALPGPAWRRVYQPWRRASQAQALPGPVATCSGSVALAPMAVAGSGGPAVVTAYLPGVPGPVTRPLSATASPVASTGSIALAAMAVSGSGGGIAATASPTAALPGPSWQQFFQPWRKAVQAQQLPPPVITVSGSAALAPMALAGSESASPEMAPAAALPGPAWQQVFQPWRRAVQAQALPAPVIACTGSIALAPMAVAASGSGSPELAPAAAMPGLAWQRVFQPWRRAAAARVQPPAVITCTGSVTLAPMAVTASGIVATVAVPTAAAPGLTWRRQFQFWRNALQAQALPPPSVTATGSVALAPMTAAGIVIDASAPLAPAAAAFPGPSWVRVFQPWRRAATARVQPAAVLTVSGSIALAPMAIAGSVSGSPELAPAAATPGPAWRRQYQPWRRAAGTRVQPATVITAAGSIALAPMALAGNVSGSPELAPGAALPGPSWRRQFQPWRKAAQARQEPPQVPGTCPAYPLAGPYVYQSMLVPAYSYPNPPTFWQNLLAAVPPVRYAVANVASGPGVTADPYYTTVISECVAAGLTVLGYVDTDYTAVTGSTADANVALWESLYGVTSIFFDRSSPLVGNEPYYSARTANVHTIPGAITVLNFGTIPDSGYMAFTDIAVVFEGDYAVGWQTFSPAGWMAGYSPARFCALVANAQTTAQMQSVLVTAKTDGIGVVYVTPETSPPSYSVWPGSQYCPTEAAQISAGNAAVPSVPAAALPGQAWKRVYQPWRKAAQARVQPAAVISASGSLALAPMVLAGASTGSPELAPAAALPGTAWRQVFQPWRKAAQRRVQPPPAVTVSGSISLAPMAVSGTVGEIAGLVAPAAALPGPSWRIRYQPWRRAALLRVQPPQPVTCSGSVALAPMAVHASALVATVAVPPAAAPGPSWQNVFQPWRRAQQAQALPPPVIAASGSVALAPMAIAASGTAAFETSPPAALPGPSWQRVFQPWQRAAQTRQMPPPVSTCTGSAALAPMGLAASAAVTTPAALPATPGPAWRRVYQPWRRAAQERTQPPPSGVAVSITATGAIALAPMALSGSGTSTSISVTATGSGGFALGIKLRVAVFTSGAVAAGQNGGEAANFPASGTYDVSVTVAATGSYVVGNMLAESGTAFTTGQANSTILDNIQDATNNVQHGTFISNATTSATGAAVYGSTTAWNTVGGTVGAEIKAPAGGTLVRDSAAEPAVATSTTSLTISTGQFTPPPGSIVVALVDATGSGCTVTDSSHLTWTPLVQDGASGYAGIFLAQVPFAPPAPPPAALPGPSWRRVFQPWRRAAQLRVQPAPVITATGSVALAPMAVSASGLVIAGLGPAAAALPGPSWRKVFQPWRRGVAVRVQPGVITVSGSIALAPMALAGTDVVSSVAAPPALPGPSWRRVFQPWRKAAQRRAFPVPASSCYGSLAMAPMAIAGQVSKSPGEVWRAPDRLNKSGGTMS